MNVSIISTYKSETGDKPFMAKKISRILLELAEDNLACPENSCYISKEGVDKLRKKLT